MCAPSAPPAPDYIGAAQQQGAENIKAARTSAKLNNPDVVNPYGTQTVTYGSGFDQARYDADLAKYNTALAQYKADIDAWNKNPYASTGSDPLGAFDPAGFFSSDPVMLPKPVAPKKPVYDKYILGDPNRLTITQEFSPEQQAIYEQQTRVKQLLGGLGEQGATALQGVVGKPLDFSGAPGLPGSADATRNKVIDAMMARVNEDTDVAREIANSKLIAAGIRPGSTAYDNSMRSIDRAYNDARNQAFLASGQEATRDFAMDAELRRQAITELLAQRQVPLNEITALMSGSQVSNPFAVPGFGGAQPPQAAPIFAAQNALSGYNTDLYNAQAAGAANQQSGLIGLGGTALMAGAMM